MTAQYIAERDGQIIWLSRDLRNSSLKTNAVQQFQIALKSVSVNAANGTSRPVVLAIDVGAVGSFNTSGQFSVTNNSPTGLTVDEVLEMIMIAGANPNVNIFDLVLPFLIKLFLIF